MARDYHADAEEAAAAMANADGIVVSEVELLIFDPASVRPAATPQPAQAVAPALPYRSPTAASDIAPTYAGLKFASTVLNVYAMLCYVLGALALVGGLLVASIGLAGGAAGRSPSLAPMLVGIVTGLTPAIAMLFAGAVSHGLSAACVALRDIARNSWR